MRRAMILGFCLLASLAGCSGETPTGLNAPVGPSYDTGLLVGSGGRSAEGVGGTPTTTSDTTANRTGLLVGSGG
jgi:hypothetical protein